MGKMDDLTLQFGTPDHGWLAIELSSSEYDIELEVSDVPCNSLYELVKVLLDLFAGSIEGVVAWSLEPAWVEWTFKSVNNEIDLVVASAEENEPLLQHQCEGSKMIKTFCRSLEKLEADPAWSEPDAMSSVWSWEFPSELLQTLKLKIYS